MSVSKVTAYGCKVIQVNKVNIYVINIVFNNTSTAVRLVETVDLKTKMSVEITDKKIKCVCVTKDYVEYKACVNAVGLVCKLLALAKVESKYKWVV